MFQLITLDDLKQLSKGDFSNSQFDYLLGNIIIPAVTTLFAQYCNRPDWDSAVRTEYFSPVALQRRLIVASPPIAASPAVQLWQSLGSPRVYGSDELMINGEDYFVYEDSGLIEHSYYFFSGPKSVKVIYTGGYLTADGVGIPGDLRLAAIAQTKILFDRREELGVSSRSQEGGSITMLSVLTLPRQVTMMLDPYRVFRN